MVYLVTNLGTEEIDLTLAFLVLGFLVVNGLDYEYVLQEGFHLLVVDADQPFRYQQPRLWVGDYLPLQQKPKTVE